MLALIATVVEYSDGSTSPNMVSNTTYLRQHRISDQRHGFETRVRTYLSDSMHTNMKRTSQLRRQKSEHGLHDFERFHDGKGEKTVESIVDQRTRFETTVTKNWHSRAYLGRGKRNRILKKLLHKKWRRETKRNPNNETTFHVMKRAKDLKRTKISNRRDVGKQEYMSYAEELPPGFDHYYVPCSSIANFIMLSIIQPKHEMFLQQIHNVSKCLKNEVEKKIIGPTGHCFKYVTKGILAPRWAMHLIGFIIVSGIIILVALFMLLLCPCLMCWRISCKTVVQAGKLDTYSDAAWAAIAIFCSVSMLFAFFAIVTVACAGAGMGLYLDAGRTRDIYTAYEEVRIIALTLEETDSKRRDTNHVGVHVRADCGCTTLYC